jgi:hypothetical protein
MQRNYQDGERDRYVYSLDFSNAFNTISRSTIANTTRQFAPGFYRVTRWAYNEPSPLILSNGTVIQSSQGVRQGDPLGSFLFSIGARPQLDSLRQRLPTSGIVSFMDDVFVTSQEATLLDTIFENFPDDHPSRLVLNRQKTRRFDLRNLDDLQQLGMPILGSMIGPADARRAFLDGKVAKTILNLRRLRHLPAQSALILLRMCIAPELTHLLRTVDCSDLIPSLTRFDDEIHRLINHLRQGTPDTAADPIAQRITNLPLSRGGLGLFGTAELQPIIRQAARDAAVRQLRAMNIPLPPPAPDEIGNPPRTQKQRLSEHFDGIMANLLQQLSEDERLLLMDNSSKHGTAWIHAIPTGPHLRLTSLQTAAAINIRLLGRGFNLPGQCRGCTAPMNIIHPELCRATPLDTTSRHNAIIGAIATALKSTNWTQAEPALTNQPNPRRADLRIGSAVVGAALHPAYGQIDLKVKSVFARDTWIARQAIQQVDGLPTNTLYHNKCIAALNVTHLESVAHYQNIQAQSPVIPIVISSGGTLHPQALKFFKDMIPDTDQRRRLRTAIAIILVRARAQVFPWVQ